MPEMAVLVRLCVGVHLIFTISMQATVKANRSMHRDTSNQFGSIVYDLSTQLQEMLDNGSDHQCNNTLESSNMQLSPYVFYKKVYHNYNTIPNNVRQYFDSGLYFELKDPEINLIFSKNYTCSLGELLSDQPVDHFPAALFFKVQGRVSSCSEYCYILEEYYSIRMGLPGSSIMKFGVELTETSISCLMGCSDVLRHPKIIVLNVDVNTITTTLSYGIFSKHMNRIMNERVAFVREINTACEFYIRISMKEYTTDLSGHADIYRAIYLKYVETWLKAGGEGKFILDTLSKTMLYKPTEKVKLDNVYSFVIDKHIRYADRCELPKLLETGLVSLKNVVLEFIEEGNIVNIISHCTNKSTNSLQSGKLKRNLGTLSLAIDAFDIENTVRLIQILQNSFSIKTVFTKLFAYNSTGKEELIEFAKTENISLGCIESMSITQDSDGRYEFRDPKRCDHFLPYYPHRVWEWKGVISASNHDTMQFMLDTSLEFRKNFTSEYPDSKFLIKMPVSDQIGSVIRASSFRLNIYCSQHLQDVKEFHDSVHTWAVIHEFEVIAQPLFDTEASTGWWYNIITERNLNRSVTVFPIVVRRNLPKAVEEFSQLPYNFACLHKAEIVHPKINFEHNDFSGISIQFNMTNVAAVTIKEIQKFLLFAFGKFASIEMVDSDNQVENTAKVLNKDLIDALNPRKQEVDRLNLYIEFDKPENLDQHLQILRSTDFIHVRLHLSGWENHSEKTNEDLRATLKGYYDVNSNRVDFGIIVQNCIEEINSGLSRIKSLEYMPFVKYIVCLRNPVYADNTNGTTMQFYFDTNFYIQQHIFETLGVNTIFRLSFLQPLKISDSIESYLKFLNDTNQHAEEYSIKYFMGNAVTKAKDNLLSWWTTSDPSDMADGLVFTEMESDYFGRPTEQRFKIEEAPAQHDTKTKNSILLVIVLATTSLILLTALVLAYYYHKGRIRMILTKEEVIAFRHGEEIARVEKNIGIQYIQTRTTKTMGFNEKFEIPKKNIELHEVVGHGNFGLVHSGLLNGSVKVAIKIPHADCNKETFKTILAEVKILSYLGNHPNVLAFLGACTKNIERGLIYVLTEFCSNGSLQNHLRNTTKKYESLPCLDFADVGYIFAVEILDSVGDIEKCDLYRFSYEIASGMEYIASKKVVHADLSTRNILLTADMTCKIGDFGLSRKLYEKKEYTKKSNEAMAWRWMALASLDKMEFTTKSDVWSYGITLWEIFSLGDTPYPGLTWNQDFLAELRKDFRMSKPIHACEIIYKIMLDCWKALPEERPSFTELCKSLKNISL